MTTNNNILRILNYLINGFSDQTNNNKIKNFTERNNLITNKSDIEILEDFLRINRPIANK